MPEIKKDENKKFFISILFGIAAAFIITMFVMFIMAVVITLADAGSRFASPLSSLALAVGCIAGGAFSATKNGRRGILCGVFTAAGVIIIITAVGLITGSSFSVMSLIHFAVAFLSAGIGGIIGVNKTEKRKII